METAPKSDEPEYCAVPMEESDVKITTETENYAVPFTAEVKTFDDKNTRLIFTLKVLLIFLLQAVEVGAIVMIVIACRDPQRGDMAYRALGYSALIYMVTLVLMVVIRLNFKDILHRTYNYFILVFCPATVSLLILSLLAVSDAWYERYLLIMTFLSWLCYISSAVVVLTFVYYTIHFEQKKQPENLIYIIASAAFAVIYYGGISFKVYNANDWGIMYLSGPAILSGIFLYLHYLYVLYDINSMTGSNYCLKITPHDYVKGAVNIQIDFVIFIRDCLINVFGLIGTINVDSIINIFRTKDDTMSIKEEAKTCTKDPEPTAGSLSEVSVTGQSSVDFLTLDPVNTSVKDDLLTLINVCINPLAIFFDSIINVLRKDDHITSTEKEANIYHKESQSNGSAGPSSNASVLDQSSVGFLTDQTVDIPNLAKTCTKEPGPKVHPSSDVTVPDQLTLGDVCRQIRTIISDTIIFGTEDYITREEEAINPKSNASAETSSNDSIRDQSSVGFLTDQTVDIEDEIITAKYAVPKRGANSLSYVPEVHRPSVRSGKLTKTADIKEKVKTYPKHPVTKDDGIPSSDV